MVERAGTSSTLGVIVGPVGVGPDAPAKVAKAFTVSSNTLLTLGRGVPSASTTSTGVAMTLTARIVAKMNARKILACILNKRGVED